MAPSPGAASRDGSAPRTARRRGCRVLRRPSSVRRTPGVRQYPASPRPCAASSTAYVAHAVAHRSSSSCTGSSGLVLAVTAISVGARSSFAAASGPAAVLSPSSASRPSTRNRHGFVRWWFGAQRASSSSSSSSSRGTGLGRERLVRAAAADRVLEVHLGLNGSVTTTS